MELSIKIDESTNQNIMGVCGNPLITSSAVMRPLSAEPSDGDHYSREISHEPSLGLNLSYYVINVESVYNIVHKK